MSLNQATTLAMSSDAVERIDGPHKLSEFPDHLARYRFALQWAPCARVFDLCCGIGYGSNLLAAAGAIEVFGMDICPDTIAQARRSNAMPNVSFGVGDACSPYPEAGQWDMLTCFEGIEHVKEPSVLLGHVYNAIRPGGIAVVSTPNSDSFEGGHSGNPYHISELSEQAFRTIVGTFDWSTEWYVQLEADEIWRRPAWQRAIIRRTPGLRRWRMARAQERSAPRPEARQILPTEMQPTDALYPMPWKSAASLTWLKAPRTMVVVCRKPSTKK